MTLCLVFDFSSMILELWDVVFEIPPSFQNNNTSLKKSKSESSFLSFSATAPTNQATINASLENYRQKEALISWLTEQLNSLPFKNGPTDVIYPLNYEQTFVIPAFDVLNFLI